MEPRSLQRALRADPFTRLRSDEELEQLVARAAARTDTPYSDLVELLVGTRPLSEEQAIQAWRRATDHRAAMAQELGRPVHLRVAALDLALRGDEAARVMVLERAAVGALLSEAITDPLTGLSNRRYMVTVLEHELRQRSRTTVAMIDVDALKALNDTRGHARGDEVLRGLARILQANLRRGDVAARVGGDEFVAVFAGSSAAECRGALARITATFAREFGPLGVGLSVGIAEASGGELGAGALLEQADARMYAAKRPGGREVPPPVAPPAAIYVTQKPDRILALSQAFGQRGLALLPVRTAAEARALLASTGATLLLVDLMHPPRGGLEILDQLGRGRAGGPRAAVVAPAGWHGVRKGLPEGIGLLPCPPTEGGLRPLLRGLEPASTEPLPELVSEEQADALQEAIRAALDGEADAGRTGSAAGRHELELLRGVPARRAVNGRTPPSPRPPKASSPAR